MTLHVYYVIVYTIAHTHHHIVQPPSFLISAIFHPSE